MIAHRFPWLSVLTILPLAGGIAVLLLGQSHRKAARRTAAACATAAVALIGMLSFYFQTAQTGMQFEEWYAWEPSLGLHYHLGMDGLSLLLLAISAIVVLMSLAAGWSNDSLGPVYLAQLLFLESCLFGTFTALNFLHWFLYWELSLVPAFFLIRLWGGAHRARAATQFFVYTMVGSIPLLLAFLALFLASGSFDFVELTRMAQTGQLAAAITQNLSWNHWSSGYITMFLFAGVFLGFAVKTPVVPFHAWLPLAYAEAAPETTMVLTGALSKMGVYGFLRILLPIFPEQMLRTRTVLLWIALASIVLPALTAWVQTDLRRMFAYSSINHMGYCILGIVAVAGSDSAGAAGEKAAALTGVMLQLFSHGLTAAALFWFLALLERRSAGLHGLNDFGGLRQVIPILSGLMGITLFASMGLPGLIGFPAEFLIFKGVFPLTWWAAALALVGLLVTAVWSLTLIERVFSGPLAARWAGMTDLTVTECCLLAPGIAVMFVVGVYPQWIAGLLHAAVLQLVGQARY